MSTSVAVSGIGVVSPHGDDAQAMFAALLRGTSAVRDGKEVRTLGSEWIIKDGIPYNGPQLLREVKAIVDAAKAAIRQ